MPSPRWRKEPITAESGLRDHQGARDLRFGRDYLIPKPFDRRLLPRVALAVAEAAMQTGIARHLGGSGRIPADDEERVSAAL